MNELPVPGQLHDNYAGQDFVLIAISQESVTAISNWISTHNVEYAVGKDNGNNTTSAYYSINGTGVPWHFIVGKRGFVRWNWGVGATLDDYKAVIDPLLAE